MDSLAQCQSLGFKLNGGLIGCAILSTASVAGNTDAGHGRCGEK